MIKRFFRSWFAICLIFSVNCSVLAADLLTKPLNNQVSVTGQMTLEKFSDILSKENFKSVILHRPDTETGNVVSSTELMKSAALANVDFVYQPVISGNISDQDVENFAELYRQLPKPVLLVCRSGSRSSWLFNEATKRGLLNE